MSVPRLPPELVDLVLGHLQPPDDSETLRASTLVCSEWFPIARQHLFFVVHIREDESHNDSPRFLHVVRSSPGIGMVVKDLRVIGPPRLRIISFDVIFTLLRELPRLQHLVLYRMTIPPYLGENVPQFFLRTLTLRTVRDERDKGRRCSTILPFLDLFNVEQLNLLSVLWLNPTIARPHEIVSPTHIPPTFKASRVKLSFSVALGLDFLRHSANLSALTELDINTHNIHSLTSLGPLVGDHRCDIRTLKLRFTEISSPSRERPINFQDLVQQHLLLPLRAFRSLKSFHLAIYGLSNASAFWEVFPAFFEVLPTTLVEFHLYCPSSPFPVGIPQFDQLVHSYTNLTDIYVHSPCSEAMEKDVRCSQSGKTFHCVD